MILPNDEPNDPKLGAGAADDAAGAADAAPGVPNDKVLVVAGAEIQLK